MGYMKGFEIDLGVIQRIANAQRAAVDKLKIIDLVGEYKRLKQIYDRIEPKELEKELTGFTGKGEEFDRYPELKIDTGLKIREYPIYMKEYNKQFREMQDRYNKGLPPLKHDCSNSKKKLIMPGWTLFGALKYLLFGWMKK